MIESWRNHRANMKSPSKIIMDLFERL